MVCLGYVVLGAYILIFEGVGGVSFYSDAAKRRSDFFFKSSVFQGEDETDEPKANGKFQTHTRSIHKVQRWWMLVSRNDSNSQFF